MDTETYIVKKPHNVRMKIIMLTLPAGGWEKFDAMHAAAAEKIPMLTHDMMVSAWVIKMLSAQPESAASTVEAERGKLEESNPS